MSDSKKVMWLGGARETPIKSFWIREGRITGQRWRSMRFTFDGAQSAGLTST